MAMVNSNINKSGMNSSSYDPGWKQSFHVTLSFEEMETVPAMEASLVQNAHVQRMVHEINEFKHYFLQRVSSNHNSDIAKFWLRKSKKPVLAVLLVNKPGKGLVVYRGTNMEVSMPTGSL